MPFVFFIDRGPKGQRVKKKTKREAEAARKRAMSKGLGVSRIRRTLRGFAYAHAPPCARY